MESLGILVSFGFAAFIIAIPIYLVSRGQGFLRTNLISIPIIFALVTTGTYWPHFYKEVRLKSIGVNTDGMPYEQRTRNVRPESKAKAEDLYWSLTGIGWPLHAIIGVLMVLPYPSIAWFVGWLTVRIWNVEKRPRK